MAEDGRVLLTATVVEINDGPFLYPACKFCYCKLVDGQRRGNPSRSRSRSSSGQCLKCKRIFTSEDIYHRYRLCATISDSSALVNITAFGGMLDCMFGSKATEFHQRNVSRLKEKYGVAPDSIIKAAVEQTFVGQSFIFGFKVPRQSHTDRMGQTQRKEFSLKDISQNSDGFSQRNYGGSFPQLIAVQMLPQTYSKPIITVTQSLQHLENAIEKLNLSSFDDLLNSCNLLRLKLPYTRNHDSKADSSVSCFVGGNTSERDNSSCLQSFVSSCDQSSLGFSCDYSLAQFILSQKYKQCLTASPSQKVADSTHKNDRENPLSEIDLNTQMSLCATHSDQKYDTEKKDKKRKKTSSMSTPLIRRSKRIAGKRQTASSCSVDGDLKNETGELELEVEKENEKKVERRSRKGCQYLNKNKNWPEGGELKPEKCLLYDKCQNHGKLPCKSHQCINLCDGSTAAGSHGEKNNTTWCVRKYMRGEMNQSKKDNKTSLNQLLDSSVNPTPPDTLTSEVTLCKKNSGYSGKVEKRYCHTSKTSTEMHQTSSNTSSSNSATATIRGQIQHTESPQSLCLRLPDSSQYSERSMDITQNVTDYGIYLDDMYDFENEVSFPTTVQHGQTGSRCASNTPPLIKVLPMNKSQIQSHNKDFSGGGRGQDNIHKENMEENRNGCLNGDKEFVEDMPDSEALDLFLVAALKESETSIVCHDSERITDCIAAIPLCNGKSDQKSEIEDMDGDYSSDWIGHDYVCLKSMQNKERNTEPHPSKENKSPHNAERTVGQQKKKTLSLKNYYFPNRDENLGIADISARSNVTLRRSQRKKKSQKDFQRDIQYTARCTSNDTEIGNSSEKASKISYVGMAPVMSLQDAPESEDLWKFLDCFSSQKSSSHAQISGAENSAPHNQTQLPSQNLRPEIIYCKKEQDLPLTEEIKERKAMVRSDKKCSINAEQKRPFLEEVRKETKPLKCSSDPEERCDSSKTSEDFSSVLSQVGDSEDLFSKPSTSSFIQLDRLKDTSFYMTGDDLKRNKDDSLPKKITNKQGNNFRNASSPKLISSKIQTSEKLDPQCHDISKGSMNPLQHLHQTGGTSLVKCKPSVENLSFSVATSPQSDESSFEEMNCKRPMLQDGLSPPFLVTPPAAREQKRLCSPVSSSVKMRKYNVQTVASNGKKSYRLSRRDEPRISKPLSHSKNIPSHTQLPDTPVSDSCLSECDRIFFAYSSKQSNDSFDLFGSQETGTSPAVNESSIAVYSTGKFNLERNKHSNCVSSLFENTNEQLLNSIVRHTLASELTLTKEMPQPVLVKKVRFSEVNHGVICTKPVGSDKVGILKPCLKKCLSRSDDTEDCCNLGSQDLFSDSSQEYAHENVLSDATSDHHGLVISRESSELFSQSYSLDSANYIAEPYLIQQNINSAESQVSHNLTNLAKPKDKDATYHSSHLITVNENDSPEEECDIQSSPELFSPANSFLVSSPRCESENVSTDSPHRVANYLNNEACITPDLFT